MSQTSSYTHTAAYSERLPMSTEERPAPRGGRGGQRGRGRGRSRGRGNAHPTTMSEQHSLRTGDNQASVNTTIRRQPARPRPTHFICLPIGHHPELRTRVAAFQNALLHNEPKVPGLDSKILISPRRMHITLGVMNLIDYSQAITPRAYVTSSQVPLASHQTEAAPEAKTVQAAVQLLQALRPSIIEKLAGHDLLVGLDQMDIMRPDRGDLAKAHVMWAGPSYEGIRAQRLKRVCEFIHNEFKKAGFVVDEGRPLKLHCTVINTSYRRPGRQPFSYADIIASRAFQSIEKPAEIRPNIVGAPQPERGKKAIAIDLGEWRVDEVQICKMGSWGPEGEYVSVGNISLK